MKKPQYLILGLDIGVKSCGWALLDKANHSIVDLGVHLWDVPQEDKTKKSLAANRRENRSIRRNIKRKSDRKKHCLNLFKDEGLIPSDVDKSWLQVKKGDSSPLQNRVKGLDSKLSNRAWAQALYNIISRRGYIPHGEGSSDTEGKKVLKALEENIQRMKDNRFRTVGEMLFNSDKSRNHAGDYSHCVTNVQLVEEVKTLFEAQRNLGNEHAKKSFEEDFIKCMTWQKPSEDHDERVYSQVGQCIYFGSKEYGEEPRAAKACLSFEKCCAYERLGHTVVVYPDGSEHKLPPDIRRKAIDILFSPRPIANNKSCKVTYKKIREWMDLPALCCFKGVDFDSEQTEIFKPKIWAKERDLLPAGLMEKLANDKSLADKLGSALAYASTEGSLREQLSSLNLTQEEVNEIVTKLPFNSKAFSGYGNRSLKALDLLLNAFEETEIVCTLSEAEDASGLFQLRTKKTNAKNEKLPPYIEFDPTCKNPVVLRVMGRVRKVVNAIISEYGMPNEIHIELARELKHSEKEKKSIAKNNSQRRNSRAIALKKLAEDLRCEPDEVPGWVLRKYELWVEQDGRDLYCDEPIEYMRMLNDQYYCQIDHILPYSRTCDNSQMNKILVLSKSNQDKREQSPFEWLSKENRWAEFEKRIQNLAQTGYPYKKRQRLLEKNLEDKQSGFIERNLNDTRYASLAAKNYIEEYLDFPKNEKRKQHVVSVAGGATAMLRNAWGLKKNREENDCHHAMDAAVIAACNESALIKVGKAIDLKHTHKKEDRKKLFENTEPWPGFHNDVENLLLGVIPTYKIEKTANKRLFKDMTYSYKGKIEGKPLALLERSKSFYEKRNYVIGKDGISTKLPDGQFYVRLWWLPQEKKGNGAYALEVAYFSDLDNIMHDKYSPTYMVDAAKCEWPIIDIKTAKEGPILYEHTPVIYDGRLMRYKTTHIKNRQLMFTEMQNSRNEARSIRPSVLKPSKLLIIDEDILGLCYKKLKDEGHLSSWI